MKLFLQFASVLNGILFKICHAVLEKDGEDELELLCGKMK
jgi:hypothetical protein